jgi:SAM-dependent methyltransferase
MVNNFNERSVALESWYSRGNGRYILDQTRAALQEMLTTSFGYHILQMGITRQHRLFDDSLINHKIYLSGRIGGDVGLVARGDALPLEGDSIDTLVAHHCLDFASDPHQVLREMQRVLAPQGQLMIIGFNPYSLLRCSTLLRGLSRESLWHHHHPISNNRLTDWLRLLGCEVQSTHHLYAVPPAGAGKLQQRVAQCDLWSRERNLPVGGLYIVHAIKQVSALHPPRRRLRFGRNRLIGLTMSKPAATPSPTPILPSPQRREVAA